MSFECLRDKRANLFVVGLAIPDVSGICPAMAKFLVFLGWFVGSSDGWEFLQSSGVPTSQHLTDLEIFTVVGRPGANG